MAPSTIVAQRDGNTAPARPFVGLTFRSVDDFLSKEHRGTGWEKRVAGIMREHAIPAATVSVVPNSGTGLIKKRLVNLALLKKADEAVFGKVSANHCDVYKPVDTEIVILRGDACN